MLNDLRGGDTVLACKPRRTRNFETDAEPENQPCQCRTFLLAIVHIVIICPFGDLIALTSFTNRDWCSVRPLSF